MFKLRQHFTGNSFTISCVSWNSPESQLCKKDDQEDDPGEESEQAGESKLIQQDRLQLGQQEGRTHLHHHQDANHGRPGGGGLQCFK